MEEIDPQTAQKVTIHHVLAHSYLIFFMAIVVGLVLEYFLPYNIPSITLVPIGFLLMFLGTVVILWAQQTSNELVRIRGSKPALELGDFMRGPYRMFRSPTHIGLGILVLGLGCVLQSVTIIITVVIGFFISRYLFVREEEKLLLEKYGDVYREYQNRIKF